MDDIQRYTLGHISLKSSLNQFQKSIQKETIQFSAVSINQVQRFCQSIFYSFINSKRILRFPMSTASFPHYGNIQGTILIIGYGSIGQAILPIIKRHFTYEKLYIIDPIQTGPNEPAILFENVGLTQENYVSVLDRVFGDKKGFCVNVSVQTSSKDILLYCQSKGILYLDTVVEQWEGFYSNTQLALGQKSNYALREKLRSACKQNPYKTTAISCCGANPGMVSWLVKKALMNIAKDTNFLIQKEPQTKQQWALLMKNLGIKGIHIAQRDTQRSLDHRPIKQFWNTWSVDGFISEALHQASELGWGTHQKWMPQDAQTFDYGPKCAIYLKQPGMSTKVKSWCPTFGPQFGYLVTHNQSISIPDYFTVWQGETPIYRPTCHYAYHPTDQTVNSVQECLGSGKVQQTWKILKENEIADGFDELGVFLYGHQKNAYWFGNKLTIQETIKQVEKQNATGLQVTSAILAGMIWALQHPNKGVVQTEEMDYKKCLQIQQTYIGSFVGHYTDWTPLQNKSANSSECAYDASDAWQFKNILINGK